jgi:lipoate-protein ligase A
MAIDEAIMEAHSQNMCPPTLRLYGFSPPAVSIGLNQKLSQEIIENITKNGFQIVRRPTGGRAVLHLDDLTYSFIGKTTDDPSGFLSTSITAAYKQICLGLQNAFALLNIQPEIGQTARSYRHIADCFQSTCGADLHVSGKKLVGSAQVKRKNVVLQHGSILLKQEQNTMSYLLKEQIPDPNYELQLERHANLFDLTNNKLHLSQLEKIIKVGFEQAFAVSFETQTLNKFELNNIERLKANYQFKIKESAFS